MSLKILYSPIFNSMNYTKYFKPMIYEQYKSTNKQLTFNAKVDYNIMKYEISEYYMYNHNNINIFKIFFNIEYYDINIIEKNIIGSYNNKNILLSNHILCDNKNINYNNINTNILDTLHYIKYLEIVMPYAEYFMLNDRDLFNINTNIMLKIVSGSVSSNFCTIVFCINS